MTGRVHFVGIGGIGMSALAQILLARGVPVSGSDLHESPMTAQLASLGADVTIGHRSDLVQGAASVVVSDAIGPDNPEVVRARSLGLPVRRRSELLAELMSGCRGIAVSGTHGKTTVTAMVGAIVAEAGLDPTVVLGGEYPPLGGNARVGGGEWFAAEACEAYESFLDLEPEIAVVTNIEPDHLDHHKSLEHLRQSFVEFVHRVSRGGSLVLCADRPELTELPLPAGRSVVWYGTAEQAEVRGVEIASAGREGKCLLHIEGRPAGELRVKTPGRHNLVNALGAVAAARETGASLDACRRALAKFVGVGRRFEVLGEASGIAVVDDYAHHPTEIAASISAARAAFPGRRVVALFQPHLYSRTRDFAGEFASALGEADLTILTEIYPARESPIPGVTSGMIADQCRRRFGKDALLEVAKEALTADVPGHLRSRDVLLVMGAGDIGAVAHHVLHGLGGPAPAEQEVVAKQ
jgi:UDP-N-acetylmuramate--alanine ligase